MREFLQVVPIAMFFFFRTYRLICVCSDNTAPEIVSMKIQRPIVSTDHGRRHGSERKRIMETFEPCLVVACNTADSEVAQSIPNNFNTAFIISSQHIIEPAWTEVWVEVDAFVGAEAHADTEPPTKPEETEGYLLTLHYKKWSWLLCTVLLFCIQSGGPQISSCSTIGWNSPNSVFLGRTASVPKIIWTNHSVEANLLYTWFNKKRPFL